MQTKIKVSNLVKGNNYWCVYSIRQACQLLLVKFSNQVSETDCDFVVLENEDGELKETFPLRTAIVDGEVNLFFEYDNKEEATVYWSYRFIKQFENIANVEYSDFLSSSKKLMDDYPELVLKGI